MPGRGVNCALESVMLCCLARRCASKISRELWPVWGAGGLSTEAFEPSTCLQNGVHLGASQKGGTYSVQNAMVSFAQSAFASGPINRLSTDLKNRCLRTSPSSIRQSLCEQMPQKDIRMVYAIAPGVMTLKPCIFAWPGLGAGREPGTRNAAVGAWKICRPTCGKRDAFRC